MLVTGNGTNQQRIGPNWFVGRLFILFVISSPLSPEGRYFGGYFIWGNIAAPFFLQQLAVANQK